MKKRRLSITLDLILLIIYSIAAISFCLELYLGAVMPWIAIIAIIIILIFISISVFAVVISSHENSILRRILLIMLVFGLLVGTILQRNTRKNDSIDYQIKNMTAMHVITRNELSSLNALNGLKIGYLASDGNRIDAVETHLKDIDCDVELVEIENYDQMIRLWKKDDIQAIAVSSVNKKLIEQYDPLYGNSKQIALIYQDTLSELKISSKDMTSEPFTLLMSFQDNELKPNITSATSAAFLVYINPYLKIMEVIALPEDLYLSSLSYDKLPDRLENLSYSGIDNLVHSISDSFRIEIDGFLHFNKIALNDTINSLEGIETQVHSSFCIDEFCFEEGNMNLNADEAYLYMNYNGDTPALKSIARLNVLEAVLKGYHELKNPSQVLNIVNVLMENAFTNLDSTNARNFMMNFMGNINNWKITFTALNAGVVTKMPCASWELKDALDVYVMGKEDISAIYGKYREVQSNQTLGDFGFSLNEIQGNDLYPENYEDLVRVDNLKKKLSEYFALQPSSTVNPVEVEEYHQQVHKFDPNFDPDMEVNDFKKK